VTGADVGRRFAQAVHTVLEDPAECDDLLTLATEFLRYCPDHAELARNMAYAAADLAIWRTAECWAILNSFAREFHRQLSPT
jgi:hypothetical protein